MLHSQCQWQVKRIGNERFPLLVIDNLVAEPSSLVEFAMHHGGVIDDPGLYPGMRSPTPPAYLSFIQQCLGPLFKQVFALEDSALDEGESRFSLVATAPESLSPLQQIPHFDRPYHQQLAMIHYLCGPEHGGTSFYRHRKTGYESVDQPRLKAYQDTVAQQIQRGEMPEPPRYINGSTALFERIASEPAQFNKALVYPCAVLHSGDISQDYQFDMNPRTGRFTITTFLHD